MESRALKAVIVEDIPEVASALRADVTDYCPELTISGVAHSVVEAGKLIKEVKPDIIFLDIEMGDGDGFDLLEILSDDLQLEVIFTTGSREHAVKAFRYSAADYLLKPIDADELVEAVARARERLKKQQPISMLKSNLNLDDKIALSTQDEIRIVKINEIARCQADGNYTHIYKTNGEKILVSSTLKSIEAKLDGNEFIRVHQSHLVNFSRVSAYLKEEGGYLLLEDGTRVPVSIRKKALVLKKLNQYL